MYVHFLPDRIRRKKSRRDKEITLSLLAAARDDDRYQKRLAERYKFFRNLYIKEKRNCCRCISRCSLNKSSNSAQAKAWGYKDEQNLITATGFGVYPFQYLLESFEPILNSHTPHTKDFKLHNLNNPGKGRRRLIDDFTCLWLYLNWTITISRLWVLQFMFNMNHPSLVVYLRCAWRILLDFMQKDECDMIRRPSNEEISDFQRVIGDKYHLIDDAY